MLILTYVLAFIIGCISVFQQCLLFALADHLPPSITQATMFGIAIAGVITSILRIISKALVKSDYDGSIISGYIYFGCALFYNFLCFISMYFIGKNVTVKPYWSNNKLSKISSANVVAELGLTDIQDKKEETYDINKKHEEQLEAYQAGMHKVLSHHSLTPRALTIEIAVF